MAPGIGSMLSKFKSKWMKKPHQRSEKTAPSDMDHEINQGQSQSNGQTMSLGNGQEQTQQPSISFIDEDVIIMQSGESAGPSQQSENDENSIRTSTIGNDQGSASAIGQQCLENRSAIVNDQASGTSSPGRRFQVGRIAEYDSITRSFLQRQLPGLVLQLEKCHSDESRGQMALGFVDQLLNLNFDGCVGTCDISVQCDDDCNAHDEKVMALTAENKRLEKELKDASRQVQLGETRSADLLKRSQDFEDLLNEQVKVVENLKKQLDALCKENRLLTNQMTILNSLFSEVEKTGTDSQKTAGGSKEHQGKVQEGQEVDSSHSKSNIERLAHHTENASCVDDSCYKTTVTPGGLQVVISLSKTYLKLKDLILEKKDLQKELDKLKNLNSHLESKVNKQERRLSLVKQELSKTWGLVSKLKVQHERLHTSESVLRYDLSEKRALLDTLKEELEFSREKWVRIRQKNFESEKEWNSIREEFRRRKQQSQESGFSDNQTFSELSSTEDVEPEDISQQEENIENLDSPLPESVQADSNFFEEPSTSEDSVMSPTLDNRARRLQTLEEQCHMLYNKLMESTARSTVLASRLVTLHENYGSREPADSDDTDDDLQTPSPDVDSETLPGEVPDLLEVADGATNDQCKESDDLKTLEYDSGHAEISDCNILGMNIPVGPGDDNISGNISQNEGDRRLALRASSCPLLASGSQEQLMMKFSSHSVANLEESRSVEAKSNPAETALSSNDLSATIAANKDDLTECQEVSNNAVIESCSDKLAVEHEITTGEMESSNSPVSEQSNTFGAHQSSPGPLAFVPALPSSPEPSNPPSPYSSNLATPEVSSPPKPGPSNSSALDFSHTPELEQPDLPLAELLNPQSLEESHPLVGSSNPLIPTPPPFPHYDIPSAVVFHPLNIPGPFFYGDGNFIESEEEYSVSDLEFGDMSDLSDFDVNTNGGEDCDPDDTPSNADAEISFDVDDQISSGDEREPFSPSEESTFGRLLVQQLPRRWEILKQEKDALEEKTRKLESAAKSMRKRLERASQDQSARLQLENRLELFVNMVESFVEKISQAQNVDTEEIEREMAISQGLLWKLKRENAITREKEPPASNQCKPPGSIGRTFSASKVEFNEVSLLRFKVDRMESATSESRSETARDIETLQESVKQQSSKFEELWSIIRTLQDKLSSLQNSCPSSSSSKQQVPEASELDGTPAETEHGETQGGNEI